MSDQIQRTFMRVLLDTPGVTRKAIARRVGVDPTQVSRWANGDRNLRLGDALYLVERFGPEPLVAAARVVGLEVSVDSTPDAMEGDTAEVMMGVLGSLLSESLSLTRHLTGLRESSLSQVQRIELVQRLAALEGMCRAAQAALLDESKP